MVRTQQNILISSVNRTSGSEGTSDFTVRLDRPIEDVVRTDLRELIVMYTPPVSSPYTEGGSYVVGNVVSFNGKSYRCIATAASGYGPYGGYIDTYWVEITDLRSLPFLAIQSTQLGNNILSSTGVSMYDLVPLPNNNWPFVYQRYANRVDSMVYTRPITLYQIDIRFIDPSGKDVDFAGGDVYVLLEVITDDKSPSSTV